MSTKIRRSAGSYTPLESWLQRAGLKRRDPEADLLAFTNGDILKILCLAWTLGKPHERRISGRDVVLPKGGWLFATRGADPVWRRSGGSEEVTIPAHAELRLSDRPMRMRSQTALSIVTAEAECDIGVRSVDVPLLFLILGPKSDQPPAHDGPLRHSTP